jgi:hypothetical protein
VKPLAIFFLASTTAKFGRDGIALTIYDREQNKQNLDKIIKFYDMAERMQTLQGADHLKG